MNNVSLIGRMTHTPELRELDTGYKILRFSIAVPDDFDREKTYFINCVAWNKTAEIIESYVSKGQQIAISGSIQTRNYEDREGNNRTAFEVNVSNFTFIGNKNDNAESKPASAPAKKKNEGFEPDFEALPGQDDEDLPF